MTQELRLSVSPKYALNLNTQTTFSQVISAFSVTQMLQGNLRKLVSAILTTPSIGKLWEAVLDNSIPENLAESKARGRRNLKKNNKWWN